MYRSIGHNLLFMRVRGRGESLEELGRSIRRLVLQSYPALPTSAREDLAVEAFRNALGDEQLQRHVFASRATTLAEAITLATEMEAFLESQAHQQRVRFGAKEVRVVEESPAGAWGKTGAAGGDPLQPNPALPTSAREDLAVEAF